MPPNDFYDPDDVLPQNSPLMKATTNLGPEPSPPPSIPLSRVSHSPSPGRSKKSSNRRRKIPASQGDAVLIHYLGDGKNPEFAAVARERPLECGSDSPAESESEDNASDASGVGEETRSPNMSPAPHDSSSTATHEPGQGSMDFRSLAIDAVGMLHHATGGSSHNETRPMADSDMRGEETAQDTEVHDTRTSGLAAPQVVSPLQPPRPHEMHPPVPYSLDRVLKHPNEGPHDGHPHPHGELPPIQVASPHSETSSHSKLPPILSIFPDQLSPPPKPELPHRSGQPLLPHSPPGGAPRLSHMSGSHVSSPPISPNNSYQQHGMPSPAQSLPVRSPYGSYYSGASNSSHHPSSTQDFSSSTTETTPNSDLSSTPGASITDRMSIDTVTNPVGAFVCTFDGCRAAPFQTQYLLNSHANVHSSARPHYCPVKGCPRSEGGKGFKRKNEMIRHGLVHDSPGYVCPFCPDREHKYPRPDNLQRHVRVHHPEKDKDDALLRDVLAQRPDGPSRGRRRRGGP